MALIGMEHDKGIVSYNQGTAVSLTSTSGSNKYTVDHNGYISAKGPSSGAGVIGLSTGYITVNQGLYYTFFIRKGMQVWQDSGTFQGLNYKPDLNE